MTDDAPPPSGHRMATMEATDATGRANVLAGGARYGKSGRPSNPTPQRLRADGVCLNCDRRVSSTFARVFGDNHDRVYGCFECMTISAIKEGKARTANEDTRSW